MYLNEVSNIVKRICVFPSVWAVRLLKLEMDTQNLIYLLVEIDVFRFLTPVQFFLPN